MVINVINFNKNQLNKSLAFCESRRVFKLKHGREGLAGGLGWKHHVRFLRAQTSSTHLHTRTESDKQKSFQLSAPFSSRNSKRNTSRERNRFYRKLFPESPSVEKQNRGIWSDHRVMLAIMVIILFFSPPFLVLLPPSRSMFCESKIVKCSLSGSGREERRGKTRNVS